MVNLSWNRPTGNFWVDTGLVVLLRQFGEGEHSVEGVLEWLRRQLLQPSGNRGEYYDEARGQIREYNKVNSVAYLICESANAKQIYSKIP